jgi:hypothetical protein
MSTSHETTHLQPAESGSCCGGSKPAQIDGAAPPTKAAKASAPAAQPTAKEPKPRPAHGGSCGCGH